MISVEEALERILSYVDVLEPEERPLLDALGQVLAEDATADFDIPPLDNTAMDGYAVRAQDTRGASPQSPVELRVIGEVAAGYRYEGEVEPGTAVRIMTGAPVPPGARWKGSSVSSKGTMASAPGGTGAPVMMRTAVPGSTRPWKR